MRTSVVSRGVVEAAEAALPPGGWPNYVLGNHDEHRIASRVGSSHAPLLMLAKNTRRAGRPGLRMVRPRACRRRPRDRPGDVAIAISASGTSPNVVSALEAAGELGIRTIGLCGPDGGKMPELVDVCLRAAGPRIEQIEDVHLVINHLFTVLLRGGDADF